MGFKSIAVGIFAYMYMYDKKRSQVSVPLDYHFKKENDNYLNFKDYTNV